MKVRKRQPSRGLRSCHAPLQPRCHRSRGPAGTSATRITTQMRPVSLAVACFDSEQDLRIEAGSPRVTRPQHVRPKKSTRNSGETTSPTRALDEICISGCVMWCPPCGEATTTATSPHRSHHTGATTATPLKEAQTVGECVDCSPASSMRK